MTTIEQVLADETTREGLREQLAELAHGQWSGWMRFLFTQGRENPDGSFTIWDSQVKRWKRQMMSAYYELPGAEQLSDQAEADRYLALFDALIQADHESHSAV